MKVTYIHHSGFLVETERFYYLFDYEKGSLPDMDRKKTLFVLSSHSHGDHYNAEIFPILKSAGMQDIRAVLSDDIEAPADVPVLLVSPGNEYAPEKDLKITTFKSTDLGTAFLLEDRNEVLYHAGDLNDWVWDDESDAYNEQMTIDYQKQIRLLSEKLRGREIDCAFVVLDPRQEKDYDRGMCYFLEHISAKQVYPMHYWDDPSIIDIFLKDHPEYKSIIQRTE